MSCKFRAKIKSVCITYPVKISGAPASTDKTTTVPAVVGVTTGYGYGGTGANGNHDGVGSQGGTSGAKGAFLYAFNHVA